jgi:hypothetical protein
MKIRKHPSARTDLRDIEFGAFGKENLKKPTKKAPRKKR